MALGLLFSFHVFAAFFIIFFQPARLKAVTANADIAELSRSSVKNYEPFLFISTQKGAFVPKL